VRLQCAKDGCSALLFSNISGPLCKQHDIEAKHEASRNAPKAAPPQSKPINKAKLYPAKPSDKPFMTRDRSSEKAQVKRRGSFKSVVPPTKPATTRRSHVAITSRQLSLPGFERHSEPSSDAASLNPTMLPITTSSNLIDNQLNDQPNSQNRTDPPTSKNSDRISRSPVETFDTIHVSGASIGNAQQSVLTCWYWAHSPISCRWSDEKCKYLHGISSFGVAEPPHGRRSSIQHLSRSTEDDVTDSTIPKFNNMSTENGPTNSERVSGKDRVSKELVALSASAGDESSEYEPPSPHQLEASSPEYEPPPPLDESNLDINPSTIMPTKKDKVRYLHPSSAPVVVAHQQHASATVKTQMHSHYEVGSDVGVIHKLTDINVPSPFQKATTVRVSGKPLGYKSPYCYSEDDENETVAPSKFTSAKLTENAQGIVISSSYHKSIDIPTEGHEDGEEDGDDLGEMEMDLDTPEPDLNPVHKQSLPSIIEVIQVKESCAINHEVQNNENNELRRVNETQTSIGEGLDDAYLELVQADEAIIAAPKPHQLDINAQTRLPATFTNNPSRTDSGFSSPSLDSHRIPSKVISNDSSELARLNEAEVEVTRELSVLQGECQGNLTSHAQSTPRINRESEEPAHLLAPVWADLIGVQILKQPKRGEEPKAVYDCTTLDTYLRKPLRDPDYEPSDREVLDTQIWAPINPLKTWPKDYSEEWRAAKMKEIAARPKRKSKNRYPRVENGGLARSEEEVEQAMNFCETLFGVDLGDIRGGTLGLKDERWICVKEAPEPEPEPESEQEIQETDSEEVKGDWDEDEVPSQATKRSQSQIDEDEDLEMADVEVEAVDEITTPRKKRKR
jgi:hypothetical protein